MAMMFWLALGQEAAGSEDHLPNPLLLTTFLLPATTNMPEKPKCGTFPFLGAVAGVFSSMVLWSVYFFSDQFSRFCQQEESALETEFAGKGLLFLPPSQTLTAALQVTLVPLHIGHSSRHGHTPVVVMLSAL